MSEPQRARTSDRGILSASDVILDEIVERFGIVPDVAPSAAGKREIDAEVAGLRGSAFDGLPAREIPLEAFHVDEPGAPAPVSPALQDSFPPIAMGAGSSFPPSPAVSPPSTPPAPEHGRAWRRVPWVLGYAVTAGIAALVTAGAMTRTAPETKPAVAAAVPSLPADRAPVPDPIVPAPDPAPPSEPAFVPVSDRVLVPGPSPVPSAAPRFAPLAAAVSARAARPTPAPAPDPEPGTAVLADLARVVPPPPTPGAAFNRAAAAIAVAGAARAASCRQAGADPTPVPVRVTFASSGSATSAMVTGGALLATPEGACLAAALRGARVPPFDGDPIAVTSVVHLP